MDKNDILDYVTKTPANTNRAVLGSMLDSMGGGGETSSFVVNVDLTSNEETGALVIESVDKTLSEVRTAYTNGSDIKAKMTLAGDSSARIMPLSSIDMTDGADSFGAQFDGFSPTFENATITAILGFHFAMFPNGNVFEYGIATFS